MSMTPERWRAVKALFDQALEQPEGARTAWVCSAAAGDATLRQEVESLLAALAAEQGRFDRTPTVLAGDAAPLGLAEAGEKAGPYRLVRQVGRGGMGVVFEAYRDDDQFKKRVAIKTISRGMDSEVILRRFRHERQILARLEHKNIAGLLDGGVTAGGQPFFALELIEGIPLDQYCDARGLGVRERLQLFRQVCGAVQYAHTNLVIHRDLKPSNILVTADGTVKLLDFGIAKLLREDDDSADGDGLTQPGTVPQTTAYASPEQVRGEAVTTATDVFSLGLVLYKVLAGRHPFAHDGPSAAELRRRIVDATPSPPSAVLPAEQRRVQRMLRGDLDSIVMMALRKEPGRRYASVEQLGGDLLRFLSGLPVAAQPDSAGYRLRKFVRRNRTPVIGAAAALLALLAGLGTTAWQARVALRERDRARTAAERAERISGFLQNMLGAADPSWYAQGERPGPQSTIGTVFDVATRRAESELAREPEVLADVLRTLGRANQALRRSTLALAQLTRAHELHARTSGAVSADAARDEHELGMAYYQSGDLATAEQWYRRSLATYRALRDSLSDDYGRVLGDLGVTLGAVGRPAEAEPFVRASAEHRKRFDSSSVANAVLLGNLGVVLSQQGKLAEAEPVYRAALAAFDRFRPREYFERGWTLGNLVVDLLVEGKPAEALPLARQQIDVFSRLLGPTHPTVGIGWVNLARVLHAQGDERGALAATRRADSLFHAALPEGHPDFARSENVWGQILLAEGKLPEAEQHLRRALAIRRAKLAPGSPHTADVESWLGTLLVRTHRYAEAETLLVSAHRALRAGLGAADPRVLQTLRTLIGLYEVLGRSSEARAYRDSLPGGVAGPP